MILLSLIVEGLGADGEVDLLGVTGVHLSVGVNGHRDMV